jgi:hypothetical protein
MEIEISVLGYALGWLATSAASLPLVHARSLGPTKDAAGSALGAVLIATIWPLSGPWLVLTWWLHRKEVAARRANDNRVTAGLDDSNVLLAYDVIRRHEDAQRVERDKRNQRLREDWEALSGIKTYARRVGSDRTFRTLNRAIEAAEADLEKNRRTSGS